MRRRPPPHRGPRRIAKTPVIVETHVNGLRGTTPSSSPAARPAPASCVGRRPLIGVTSLPFSIRGHARPAGAVPIRRPPLRSYEGTRRRHPKAGAALVFATGGADYAGGLNAVVTVGSVALLFLWRGYAGPAPRARPAPRIDAARGVWVANAIALLVAKLTHLRGVDRPAP